MNIKFETYKIENINGRAQNVILSQYMDAPRARRALATMLKEFSSHEYWSNNPTTYNIVIKWLDGMDIRRPYKELRIRPMYYNEQGRPGEQGRPVSYWYEFYSRPVGCWQESRMVRNSEEWIHRNWQHMVCPRCGFVVPHWALNLPHHQHADARCCCNCGHLALGYFEYYDPPYMDEFCEGEPSTTATDETSTDETSTDTDQIHEMLHSYSCKFKKSQLENVSNSAKLRLGAELETELLTLPSAKNLANCLQSLRLEHDLIIKSDGSLTDGAEFVTLPLKKDKLKRTLSAIIDNILQVGTWRSWNGGNCGVHIHANRKACNISALLHFFIDYKEDIKKLSGRKNWRFCDYYIYKNNKNDSRYLALNFQNSNTVEFRLWRGSLKKSTLNAYVDFTYEVCRLGRKLKNMNFQQVVVSSQSRDLYETAKLRGCGIDQITTDHKGKLLLLPEAEAPQTEAVPNTAPQTEAVPNIEPEVVSEFSREVVAEALQAMLEGNNWGY